MWECADRANIRTTTTALIGCENIKKQPKRHHKTDTALKKLKRKSVCCVFSTNLNAGSNLMQDRLQQAGSITAGHAYLQQIPRALKHS